MHEGRPPSVTTFIHFCAPATVAKRSCPDFSMHAAVARSAFWFRWMNALAAVGRPCKTVAKRNFHTPGWVFGGFGGSIAPNCGETRILSSKSCPAQSTRRFNAQHMEHGTMNVAATLCFRSRSYIVSRVFKVAPVLDVSIVIQCGISVVLQFSSQQLCFASARWLRAVYWTFQVWFNVVSTLCSAIQQLRECYIVFCICKLAPRGRFKCDLMWYFQCALHPRLRTLYWTFQERKHTKNTNATYTHTHTYRSEGGICFTSRCDVQRVCDHSLFYLGSNNRQRRDGLNKCLTVYSVELMFWTLMRCHGQSC